MGKAAKRPAPDEDEPYLVAVPERGDGLHHGITVRIIIAVVPERMPDTEVIAVKDDIEDHGKADEGSPRKHSAMMHPLSYSFA